MKKILVLLLTIAPMAQAMDIETCENAKGTPFTVNGHTYCRSSMALNWFSGRTWCMSLGSDLIDLSIHCPGFYKTGTCEYLNVSGLTGWAQNISHKHEEIAYYLSEGGIPVAHWNTTKDTTQGVQALCQ